MPQDAFFTVHQDLPREGPGEAADVHWALDIIKLSGAVCVLDAGCGPGSDTVTLAQALPNATIVAIDKHPGFVAQAKACTEVFGSRVQPRLGDIAQIVGPYDLIWCAGALYFLGVTEGLKLWRSDLGANGFVAFSEPAWINDTPSDAARAFWAEYPAITGLDGIAARIECAGYELVAHRLIVGAPWREYYAPMKARLDVLRTNDPSPDLIEAIDLCAREAELWEEAQDEIAYALCVVKPA